MSTMLVLNYLPQVEHLRCPCRWSRIECDLLALLKEGCTIVHYLAPLLPFPFQVLIWITHFFSETFREYLYLLYQQPSGIQPFLNRTAS